GPRNVQALLSPSDSVSCSSRMIETSTVTPSFFTIRECPDLTILGSRSIIAASKFGAVLFDRAGVFQTLAALPRFAAIFGGVEELANALEEADLRRNRSSADNARGKRRDYRLCRRRHFGDACHYRTRHRDHDGPRNHRRVQRHSRGSRTTPGRL